MRLFVVFLVALCSVTACKKKQSTDAAGARAANLEDPAAYEGRCDTKKRVLDEVTQMGQSCGAFGFKIGAPGDAKACNIARSAGVNASSSGACKDLCETFGVLDTSDGPTYCVYQGEILSL